MASWINSTLKYGMPIVILYFVSVLDLSSQENPTCAPVHLFPQLDTDTLLTDSGYMNISTGSLLTCVKQCQVRRRCASYSFNLYLGICTLNEKSKSDSLESSLVNVNGSVFSDINTWPSGIAGACADHNCTDTTDCKEVSETDYECVTTQCTDPPSVSFGKMVDAFSFWDVNQTVQYECQAGYEPVGERVCRTDGSWSYFECLKVGSCADLKVCNSEYGDGEYWLRPEEANGTYVKVYCSGMNQQMPSNFVTLEGENYSYYLDSDLTECEPFWSGDNAGTTTFKKVKFNIWKFGFQHGNYAFAETNGKFGLYGRSGDCRTKTTCNATETGSFRIDTTGTGLKIVDSLEWGEGTTVTRSKNGTVITGVCFRNCNLCKPLTETGFGSGMFKVELDHGFKPNFTTATFPVCKANV